MRSILKRAFVLCVTSTVMSLSLGGLLHAQTEIQAGDGKAEKENLVRNGSFDSDNAWYLETDDVALATVHFDKMAKVARTRAGKEASHIRLSQLGVNLTKDKSYRLSLRAKANKETLATLRVHNNKTIVKPEDLILTREWTEVTTEFTMRGPSEPEAKVSLELGTGTGDVFVDDVRLVELSPEERTREAHPTLINGVPKTNLISNPNFNVSEGWQLEMSEGAIAAARFDGVARILRYEGGQERWKIRFFSELFLPSNLRYRVSFHTRAEKKTSFNIVMIRAAKPQRPYSDYWQPEVGTDWMMVTEEFEIANDGGPARILFNLGKTDGFVLIDDVVIEAIRPSSTAAKVVANDGGVAVQPEKSSWDPNDIVKSLEGRIAELQQLKRKNKTQKLEFKDLQDKLEIASYIENQVATSAMTQFAMGKIKNEKYPSVGDTFVVAKITATPDSKVADFEFATVEGYAKCTTYLYYFLAGASETEFRDYRVYGRFSDTKLSGEALVEIRRQYDAQKKEQAAMLAYVKKCARKKAARIKRISVSSVRRT